MEETNLPEVITTIIFIVSYILIFSGRLERTAAALLGLFIMISTGYIFGFFTFEDLLGHVDWDVIILLFGMMTYVGLMAKTGFFKYIGMEAIKLSKGEPWLIFLYLSLTTTFISMIIDNVTTILLVIPITVEVAELLGINPIPIMLGEAILSNVGGVGTMIGDPPNIMIAFASKYTFNDFIIHLFPPVICALIVSTILARVVYGRWIKIKPRNAEELMKIESTNYIRNKRKMRYYLYILIGMIILFVTQSYTGISPAFIALAGGIIALIISAEEPKEAFKSVEWPTLVFFIALFSLVGGLEETGVLKDLARGISLISSDSLITAIMILWISGIASSFVDNIPITAAFIPVVSSLSMDYNSSLLWWTLAMGVGMGGNITPIGSSANVVTVSLSKRYGYGITNREWLKFGTITAVASMAVCTVFILLMSMIYHM